MSNRILIEGLDLVGKTTLCNKLVNDYPEIFVYKKSIYSFENELYNEVVKKSKTNIYSEETIAWMYIAAARHELDLLSKEITEDDGKIILQDSFFLNRMIGVHGIKQRKILLEQINALLQNFEEPLYTFYIYSDLSIRRKRFIERQKIKEPAFGDKLIFEYEEQAIKREALFRKYIIDLYNAEVIDNSYEDIENVENKIYQRILQK